MAKRRGRGGDRGSERSGKLRDKSTFGIPLLVDLHAADLVGPRAYDDRTG